MADEILKRDQNSVTVMAGVGNDSDQDILMLRSNPLTKKLLVESVSIDTNGDPIYSWVSSSIDMTDATNYYFLSFIPNTTKWRINQLNKTTYESAYKVGDSNINLAWDDRKTYLYDIIY